MNGIEPRSDNAPNMEEVVLNSIFCSSQTDL